MSRVGPTRYMSDDALSGAHTADGGTTGAEALLIHDGVARRVPRLSMRKKSSSEAVHWPSMAGSGEVAPLTGSAAATTVPLPEGCLSAAHRSGRRRGRGARAARSSRCCNSLRRCRRLGPRVADWRRRGPRAADWRRRRPAIVQRSGVHAACRDKDAEDEQPSMRSQGCETRTDARRTARGRTTRHLVWRC